MSEQEFDVTGSNTAFNYATGQLVSPHCILPDGTQFEGKDVVEQALGFIKDDDNRDDIRNKLYSLASITPNPMSFMVGYVVASILYSNVTDPESRPRISVDTVIPSKEQIKVYLKDILSRRKESMDEHFNELMEILDNDGEFSMPTDSGF